MWVISFVIAAALHLSFFFAGKYLFVTPPEYGIQGSVASIEVYMVAALPEPVQLMSQPVIQEIMPEIPEAPSEMTVAKAEKIVEPQKAESPQTELPKKVEVEKPRPKSEVKGDGSSVNPGLSETTLSSRASSETLGRTGKYQNAPPQYPSIAERNGWEGTVILKAFVEQEGRAAQVLIDRSSGFHVLDKAALKAVRQWRFELGRIGAVKTASWIKIPIRFRIEKNL